MIISKKYFPEIFKFFKKNFLIFFFWFAIEDRPKFQISVRNEVIFETADFLQNFIKTSNNKVAEGVESSIFFCQKWIHNPKKWGYRHKFFENRITFVISRSLYFQKKCYVAAKWALIKEMNIETWKRPIFVRFSKNLCLYPHFLGSWIHFWQKKIWKFHSFYHFVIGGWPILVWFSKFLCLYPHFFGCWIYFWQKIFENSTSSTTLLLEFDQFWSDFQPIWKFQP